MRVYINGPIESVEEIPYQEKAARFDRAALALKMQGRDSINPLDVHGCILRDCNPDVRPRSRSADLRRRDSDRYPHTWVCYMRQSLSIMLAECDAIALLPDWFQSEGASLSFWMAQRLRYDIIDLTKNAIVLGLPYKLDKARGVAVETPKPPSA